MLELRLLILLEPEEWRLLALLVADALAMLLLIELAKIRPHILDVLALFVFLEVLVPEAYWHRHGLLILLGDVRA